MPIRDHVVSYRNGPQVMVAGLQLQDMGYCRGAQVEITGPTGNPANMSWEFVVSNDEHATLVCRNPPPPGWIQPNVRIQIEVRPPAVGAAAGVLAKSAPRLPGDLASALPEVSTLELALPQPRPGLPPRVIYAVDVGAPGGGLAWARLTPHEGPIPAGSTDYDLFLERFARDLRDDLPVALGFEAPLFLPVAPTIGDLTRARLTRNLSRRRELTMRTRYEPWWRICDIPFGSRSSRARLPCPSRRFRSFSLEFSHVPSGTERRSLRRTPSVLSSMSIGTKAMDLSFSATRTKNHGVTFW